MNIVSSYLFCTLLITIMSRRECCLDLIVRSFNEVFSPMIETGENRITKPHSVDDLTGYYDVPDTDEEELTENDVLQAEKYDYSSYANEPTLVESPTRTFEDEHSRKSPIRNYRNSKHPNRKDSNYYTPGERPLVDLLIRMMEMFQLTSTSKFITARPKYGTGYARQSTNRFGYVPYTYDGYR